MFKDVKIITRKQAIKQGLKKYYPGKPCKHGHVAWKYTKSCVCVECNNKKGARTKPATKPITATTKPKEPMLDYSQIGKAIVERIKQLEKLASNTVEKDQQIQSLLAEKGAAIRKIEEQHNQIEKLNRTISSMNKARPAVSSDNKFPLSELANIRS